MPRARSVGCEPARNVDQAKKTAVMTPKIGSKMQIE
jgi:hypothetical protein